VQGGHAQNVLQTSYYHRVTVLNETANGYKMTLAPELNKTNQAKLEPLRLAY